MKRRSNPARKRATVATRKAAAKTLSADTSEFDQTLEAAKRIFEKVKVARERAAKVADD